MEGVDSRMNTYQKPPILTDHNYPYWKTRMEQFLISINEEVWCIILSGYSLPTVRDENGGEILKNRLQWSPEEKVQAGWNGKALNAILAGVDSANYRHVQACRSAKEAWEKLQTIHEGTEDVRLTKLRMLNMQFMGLIMKSEETFSEFEAKLFDVINQCQLLGKSYSQEDIISKILSALPKEYHPFVTSIDVSVKVGGLSVS